MYDILTEDTFRNDPALYRLIVLEKSLKLELLQGDYRFRCTITDPYNYESSIQPQNNRKMGK